MGSGEWGVGNGKMEVTSSSPLPTPHSPLPIISVFVHQVHLLNARPAEAIPRNPEDQTFQLESLRLQPDVSGGFKIPGAQAIPFRPGLFVPEDQRLALRLADQLQIVLAVASERGLFPLIAVEDYPHISLAADQPRDRSFIRAEPFPQLINGSRIARELPSIDVINGDQQRSRERDCGERSPRDA